MTHHSCECGRDFASEAALDRHVLAVHSFDEIRQMVSNAAQELLGAAGSTDPRVIEASYVFVEDIGDSWAVLHTDGKMWAVDYEIQGQAVVFTSEPVEVVRRVVYEPV